MSVTNIEWTATALPDGTSLPMAFRSRLQYDPIYEKQAKRDVCSSVRKEWRLGNPFGWVYLAPAKTGLGPLAEKGGQPTLQSFQSRTRQRRLFPSACHAGWQARDCTCPSASLVTLQWANPTGVNDQSQERRQEGQPSGELGTRESCRPAGSCDACPEGRARLRTVRRAKQHGETIYSASSANTEQAKSGRNARRDRAGFRRNISNNLENRQQPSSSGFLTERPNSGRAPRDNGFLANARAIRDQCKAAGVAFFGKQNVGKTPLPDDLAVKEWPR